MGALSSWFIALSSSIVTIGLTKLLDLFQSKRSHRYEIEKMYFERKLVVSEAYVSSTTLLSAAMLTLYIHFDRLGSYNFLQNSEPDWFEKHVGENLENEAAKLAKQAESLQTISQALNLYYDFNFAQVSVAEKVKNIHDSIAIIGEKMNHVLEYVDESDKPIEGYNEAHKEYVLHMTGLSKKYFEIKLELENTIRLVRTNVMTMKTKNNI